MIQAQPYWRLRRGRESRKLDSGRERILWGNAPERDRGALGGWPALSASRKIVCAPRTHTTPVRPRGVKILNLGCPVLDGFSRAGLLVGLLRSVDPSFQVKSPALQNNPKDGAPA